MELLTLLNPRQQTPLIVLAFAASVGTAVLAFQQRLIPVWGAAALVLATMLIAAIPKWRADQRRYGSLAMVLSVLVAAQGFHSVEHIVQWVQYHLLGWELRASVGLLSPANAEWVHFVWNWLVLLTVIFLMVRGVRNPWMWLLLAWAAAHSFEHSYLFVRHLQVLAELQAFGVQGVTAQGLPGILGQDGWLMRSEATRNTFLCTLPGLTTAPRLDVHFWWNVGEVALLLPAANQYMADQQRQASSS
jgi:hypothetical protein